MFLQGRISVTYFFKLGKFSNFPIVNIQKIKIKLKFKMNSYSNKSQFNEMMQGMSPEEEMDESDEYTDSESDENEDGFDLQKLLAPFGYIQREYFITNRVLGRIRLINGKLTLKSL